MSASPPAAALPIPSGLGAPAPAATVSDGPPASGLSADINATSTAAPFPPMQSLLPDQIPARTCVKVIISQTDQAIYYATPIFTGNMPTLGQLAGNAAAAINSLLRSPDG